MKILTKMKQKITKKKWQKLQKMAKITKSGKNKNC